LVLTGIPSTLHFVLSNTSFRTLSNVTFTNHLPSQLVLAQIPNVHGDCDGTVLASNGTIAVFGVSLSPNQSCAVSVDVTSLTPGSYTNLADRVFSTETGPAYALASSVLAVVAPPAAATEMADGVKPSSATLNALVNPNGPATKAYFEFGATTNYGLRTPMAVIGSGWSPVPLAHSITGLVSASEYHFRVVAVSSLGTTFGRDQ
jgi:hypothetical protein